MANENRFIDVQDCPCDGCQAKPCGHPARCVKFAAWLNKTVDALEVVHGQWKYYHKQNMAVCTNCSFERDLDANFGRAISCQNCGAKMDMEVK